MTAERRGRYKHATGMRIPFPVALLAAGLLALPSRGEGITVAAAVSLKEAMLEAAAGFTRATGHEVAFEFGASGQLLAQVRNGAPIDVFIAAAGAQADALEREGLALAGSRRDVAANGLVLVVPTGASAGPASPADLAEARYRRIAIGDPALVPAGEYAMQALEAAGLRTALAGRLVFGNSVRQVLAYVERGEVDAGLVYRTDAAASAGRAKVSGAVDPASHRPIVYPAVVVGASRKPAAARAFIDYLISAEGGAILARHGFAAPPAAEAAPATRPGGPAPPGSAASQVWPSLLLSLRIAALATLLVAVVAVPLAWLMARGRFPGRSLVEALLTVPLVLPPTVVGYYLIVVLGRRGTVGSLLERLFDYTVLFRVEGAVLAAAAVALPMLYIPAKAAFASVEREHEDIARLLGASRLQLFWHVSLPMARRGIFAGLVLAFARALGEFGATLMVYGKNLRLAGDVRVTDRMTLPVLVYDEFESGQRQIATVAVVALSLLSLALILAYNRLVKARGE